MKPDLQALVDARPTAPELPPPWPREGQQHADWLAEVDRQRCAFEAQARPVTGLPEVGQVSDAVVDGRVPVRLYDPPGPGPHPAVVVLHGGGFWVGGRPAGMAAADAGMRLICSAVGAVAVNVDYRQAPEHRFPAALEDAWVATRWVSQLDGVDSSRVAVSGASAGGNLAAGVARLAAANGMRLRLQQLLVPALDATLCSQSAVENAVGTDLTREDMVRCWQLYLGPDADRLDPRVSPLLAADLSGLAAAHIVVAEHDPLRDDGLRYADRLTGAGVAVRCERLEMTHSIATPDVGQHYLESVLAELSIALAP